MLELCQVRYGSGDEQVEVGSIKLPAGNDQDQVSGTHKQRLEEHHDPIGLKAELAGKKNSTP